MMKRFVGVALVAALSLPALATINENFDAGIPGSWTTVDYLGSSPFNWTTNDVEGRANWTGPTSGTNGLCAHADSDHHAGSFDIGLISPSFVVPGGATLEYDTNYQNFLNLDWADTDISTDGGASWINLLRWHEDHGTFSGWPGVHVSLDLSAYAGQTAQIRYHYYEPTSGFYDWLWQVDNVVVTP